MASDAYDAIVILGGGLRKEGNEYYPATYEDNDGFGMLGGHMRLRASFDLYQTKAADCFMFTTGIYEKNKARLGPEVPAESEVYAARFRELIGTRPTPEIVIETVATTTLTDLIEAFKVATERMWKQIAILSSEYHLPRVDALCTMLLRGKGRDLTVEFLSAERIVKECEPGTFDQEIDEAYRSESASQRARNEQQGLQDIRDGKYAIQEFQFNS
jgi:hypothetical protein